MPLHVASLPGLTMSIGRDKAEGGRFVKVSVNIKKRATGYKSIHRNFRSKLGLKPGAMGDPSQIGLTKTQLGTLVGKNKVAVDGKDGNNPFQLVSRSNPATLIPKGEMVKLVDDRMSVISLRLHT